MKPRVVVCDDHAGMLATIVGLLEPDFEVAAAVGGGQQALEACARCDPDILVLDIEMNGLDGLQTARALQRRGSRAKIVMLSAYETADYITAAFAAGARGYVVKRKMRPDLGQAIGHVLAGRIFVPSLRPLSDITERSAHAVQFHSYGEPFYEEMAQLVAETLQQGDLLAMIVKEETRAAVSRQLAGSGVDLTRAATGGHCLIYDAREFARGDSNAAVAVRNLVATLERARIACGGSQAVVIGELSPLLVSEGRVEEAMQIEQLWDDATRTRPFVTVCCYAVEHLSLSRRPDVLSHVCAAHNAVSHSRV